MVARRFSLVMVVMVVVIAVLTACSSRASGETGSASGSQSSAGSGEDGTNGDPELEALCLTGCVRFEICAPEAYATAYADDQACFEYCFSTFSSSAACREAAEPYAACTAELACENWPELLADPATSACADSWAVAGPACGLI